ncbi:MAG: hypothetical protein HDR33_00010 [Treponema sp.]|nr:hypothetical protein [Treponema sp.]
MRRIVFLVACMNIFVLAFAETKSLPECLVRLAHCAEYGYTVKENGSDYITASIPLVGQNAIKSRDVFLRVFHERTGEQYFTKNNFIYIDGGFLRVSEEMVLSKLGKDSNSWGFRAEDMAGGKRYFIDVYDTENCGPPVYSEESVERPLLASVEISYFQCSELEETYENAYFVFKNSSKCADVLFEEDAICLSNVNIEEEFEFLKKQTELLSDKKERHLLLRLEELVEKYRKDGANVFQYVFQIEELAQRLLNRYHELCGATSGKDLTK